MIDLFVVFWTVIVFTSILWCAFQLFDTAFKAGRELRHSLLPDSIDYNQTD